MSRELSPAFPSFAPINLGWRKGSSIISYIYCFVSSLSVIEMILGFEGSLISIFGIPIRYILFFLCTFVGIFWLTTTRKIANLGVILFPCLLISFYGFVWTMIGIFNGKEWVFFDSKNFLLSLGFVFVFLGFTTVKLEINIIFGIFQYPLIILFLFSSLVWIIAVLNNINASFVISNLSLPTSLFASADNPTGRIWFVTSILLSLSIFIFGISSSNRSWIYFMIFCFFFGVALLSSGSRSLILPVVALVAASIINYVFSSRNYSIFLKRGFFILTSIFILLLTFLSIGATSRVFSPESISTAVSNSIRSEQEVRLINEYFKSPIIGSGFGHYISDYIRSNDRPYSYELFYYALLMKTGILGFMVYCLALISVLFTGITYGIKLGRFYVIFFIIYWVSIVVQGGFNPFLDTQLGIFLLLSPLFFYYYSSRNQRAH